MLLKIPENFEENPLESPGNLTKNPLENPGKNSLLSVGHPDIMIVSNSIEKLVSDAQNVLLNLSE